jgi:hypothetical protein
VPGTTTYRMKILGTADDERRPVDGVTVLSFQQAQKAAMEWCEDQERAANGQEPVEREPYTVGRAMEVASDDAWRRGKPFKGVDRPKMRYLEADEAVRLLNSCGCGSSGAEVEEAAGGARSSGAGLFLRSSLWWVQ